VPKRRGDATPDSLAGRMENIVTLAQEFDTSAQLVASVARDVRSQMEESVRERPVDFERP
jgi:hypothetical protein